MGAAAGRRRSARRKRAEETVACFGRQGECVRTDIDFCFRSCDLTRCIRRTYTSGSALFRLPASPKLRPSAMVCYPLAHYPSRGENNDILVDLGRGGDHMADLPSTYIHAFACPSPTTRRRFEGNLASFLVRFPQDSARNASHRVKRRLPSSYSSNPSMMVSACLRRVI